MSSICIIPARGGSKRIPRKNIKYFLGKPIIAYSIEAAINTNLFEDVIVSTDDDEIAKIAKQYGATVPFFRSNENSDDYATLADVVIETLNKTEKKYNYVCTLLATAPFISKKNIIEGFEILSNNKNIDTVFSVVENSKEVLRSFNINNDSELNFISPEFIKKRTQDLPKTYKDAGMFYISKTKNVLSNKKLTSGKVKLFEIDENLSQDIDTLYDWKLAEYKYKHIE
jgi:pseudaminic acid cytidylyltransferase